MLTNNKPKTLLRTCIDFVLNKYSIFREQLKQIPQDAQDEIERVKNEVKYQIIDGKVFIENQQDIIVQKSDWENYR